MHTLNFEATMNTQNHFDAGLIKPNRSTGFSRAVPRAFVLLFALLLGLPGHLRAQPTNYADEAAVATYVRQMLYWPDSPTPNSAAFRYKHLLYGQDTGGVRARVENMGVLYGAAERTLAQTAETQLVPGLTNNPASAVLGNLLLDIYYDRMVAENLFFKQVFASADYSRFAQTSAPPAWVIDTEINVYIQALQSNRVALATYVALLTNTFGVVDNNVLPLGFRLFQQWGPSRGLEAATCTNSSGQSVSVLTNSAPLFTGYKDLVLLFNLLKDYGRVSRELVRLYLCRNNTGDSALALSQATDGERFLFLHGGLLRSAFPSLAPVAGDPSGLAEAMTGCTQSLDDLAALRQSLTAKRNVLGFDPDFLMLVQKFTGGSTYYDSYDALREQLDPIKGDGQLAIAMQSWQDARAAHDSYQGSQNQLSAQAAQQISADEDRLLQLVGALPGTPQYDTPESNVGSDVWQQLQSIDVAKLHIDQNALALTNKVAEIQIELDRAAAVSNVYVSYADKQADLTEVIGHLSAAQAFASGVAEAVNADSAWGGVAQGVNGVVQAGLEEAKGQLSAKKEYQAGLEQAVIGGIESAATVRNSCKTWPPWRWTRRRRPCCSAGSRAPDGAAAREGESGERPRRSQRHGRAPVRRSELPTAQPGRHGHRQPRLRRRATMALFHEPRPGIQMEPALHELHLRRPDLVRELRLQAAQRRRAGGHVAGHERLRPAHVGHQAGDRPAGLVLPPAGFLRLSRWPDLHRPGHPAAA